MANEKQEIKKVVDILSHGESKGMYVVTAILEGGIEDTRAYPADSEEGKKFKAAAEKFVATHPKKGNHRMNLQFFGEYETRVKNAEKISKKKYTTGDLVLAGSLGVAFASLTGLALFNAYTGKTNEETTVAPETTIETTVETPVEPEDNTKEVTDLSVDDVKEITNNAIDTLNNPEGEYGLNFDPVAVQSLTYSMTQIHLSPEETNQLITEGFIPDDSNDVIPTMKSARAEIKRQNALAMDNPEIKPINMAIFTAPGTREAEICDAMYNDMLELQRLCTIIRSAEATDEEKEAARTAVIEIWESFKSYGDLNDYEKKTNLPYDYNQSTVPGQFASLQYAQGYAAAANIAGVPEKEVNYVTGANMNDAVVFVDYSMMANLIARNYNLACNLESRENETYGGLTAEEVEYIRQQYAAQEAPAEEKETTPATR